MHVCFPGNWLSCLRVKLAQVLGAYRHARVVRCRIKSFKRAKPLGVSCQRVPGTVYLNKNRYWWKVKLPGEPKIKARPLRPVGAINVFVGQIKLFLRICV